MKPILTAIVACLATYLFVQLMFRLPEPSIDFSQSVVPMRSIFLLLGRGVLIVLGIMVWCGIWLAAIYRAAKP